MRRSIKSAVRRAKAEDSKFRSSFTKDSFQNFQLKLGIGADNAISASTYGFNPITRVRTLLEWIHRGTWLGGIIIDSVADDMTRAGVSFKGDLPPAEIEAINAEAITLGIWAAINDVVKWSRLYGGSIGVMLISGQDPATPLRLNTVGRDQFKGILPLDRWMVEPTLQDLVTEMGPDLGLPKYYFVRADSPALPAMKIHHTRCFRMEGVRLPYWQRMMEMLWGISVFERLYDRMVAFDSATAGASQLVYKSYLRTYKIKDLRDVIAAGGAPMDGLLRYVDMMRRFQSIEGITLLDAEDEFEASARVPFSGLSEALEQFGRQLAGALQIPLVRLFGQSPGGMNTTGESDFRIYYDGINNQQETKLHYPGVRIYHMISRSLGIKLPEEFDIIFNPLWQLSEPDKSTVAAQVTAAVSQAHDEGLIDRPTALEELRQSARVTGIYTNISQEAIEDAEEEDPFPMQELERQQLAAKTSAPGKKNGGAGLPAKGKTNLQQGRSVARSRSKDSALSSVIELKTAHDLDVVIENPQGTIRRGRGYELSMPADYGYIRRTEGADGDQLDCYVGPEPTSDRVYVIDQVDPVSGEFDEHKVMLGYSNLKSALNTYNSGFTDGTAHVRLGAVTFLPMVKFKDWMRTADLSYPLAELKGNQRPIGTFVSGYAPQVAPAVQCHLCTHYTEKVNGDSEHGYCDHPVVKADPDVPKNADGESIVEARRWCHYFRP